MAEKQKQQPNVRLQAKEQMNDISKAKLATNVSQKLLSEFQALISLASYDSPSIHQGGSSMKESVIEAKMHRLCFGDETCDIDFLSYTDQFLLGLNTFE